MNKIQLFRILRQHIKLSEKRSAVYEQNKAAKIVIYIMGCILILYMVGMAIVFSLMVNADVSAAPYEMFFAFAPFLLIVDFIFRFIAQQTPSQLIKPYMLLPIPKYACVEMFVLSSVVTPNNLIWLAYSVPCAIMTTLFSEGFFAAVGLVVAFQLMVTINSQWYMFMRTLINRSIKWLIVLILLYSPLLLFCFFDGSEFFKHDVAALNLLDSALDALVSYVAGLVFWNPLCYLSLIAVLVAFFKVNTFMQFRVTYKENANVDGSKLKRVSEFNFFDRYGEVGEYLKLEVKSVMRNKNVRKSFVFGIVFVCLLSLAMSFTDIYSDSFSRVFWIVYNFVLFGAMSLIKIMGAEGNYIDGLMIHRENIVQLLKAKYYFYCAILVLPFLLMLPTVFTGKYTMFALVSMMCFAAGPVYCLLMQMAVYNRQTIPLNTKFVSKGNVETNYFQIVAELAAMFAPMVIISLLRSIFSDTVTYFVLMALGLVFIVLHRFWIKNIYKRFMRQRYANMESFRATR